MTRSKSDVQYYAARAQLMGAKYNSFYHLITINMDGDSMVWGNGPIRYFDPETLEEMYFTSDGLDDRAVALNDVGLL